MANQLAIASYGPPMAPKAPYGPLGPWGNPGEPWKGIKMTNKAGDVPDGSMMAQFKIKHKTVTFTFY